MKIDKLGMYRQRDGVIAEVFHMRSDLDDYQPGTELISKGDMSVMVRVGNDRRTHTVDGFYFSSEYPQDIDLVEFLPIEDYPELYI